MSSIFDKPITDSKPIELIPEGRYTGILYSVVDLGTHKDTYEGVERLKHEVHLTWELVGTEMSDGRPFAASRTYTITNGKFGPYMAKTSNIFKMLRAWTGRDEKVCSNVRILGELVKDQVPASITIELVQGKKDASKTYAIIESIKPYKLKDKPSRANEAFFFSVGQDTSALPAWQSNRVAECLELNGGLPAREDAPQAPAATTDEDFPF